MIDSNNKWKDYTVGITGATGALGRALIKKFRAEGAYVIGMTHKKIINSDKSRETVPDEWAVWNCGEENNLLETLKKIDILILNHGINPQGAQTPAAINEALEINALSSWRLMQLFENVSFNKKKRKRRSELWVNTSEAEVQPTLSPGYELSKRLIGQLVSLRWYNLNKKERSMLLIRKIILGPFQSELNPIGIMSAEMVAYLVVLQAKFCSYLIIVSPNPLTYLSIPLTEILRNIYSLITKKNKQ